MPAATRAAVVGEKAGIPAVVVAVSDFASHARNVAKGEGLPDIALAKYPGALDAQSKSEMEENLRNVVIDQIVEGLTRENATPQKTTRTPVRNQQNIVCAGTLEEVNRYFYEEGWTDGLPIIPPTIEKIEEFLKYTDRSPDEEVAVLPNANMQVTPWNIAANGVMAGCKPEYMPILLAATEAIQEPNYRLKDIGTSATLRPYFLINGPIIKKLGLYHGTGLITPAPTPNSSIGRAMHLIIRNIAGFKPGTSEMGVFGLPQSFVLAEDEELNPWEPYHVEQGFGRNTSAVTAMAYITVSNQFTLVSEDPVRHLEGLVLEVKRLIAHWSYIFGVHSAMFTFLLSPPSAKVLAKGCSKKEIKEYIVKNGTVTKRDMENLMNHYFLNYRTRPMPPGWDEMKPDDLIPIIPSPGMIHIAVCGSRQRNRNILFSGGYANPVTKQIHLSAK